MPYRLEFTIPGLPPMNTAATRRHWSVQHREAQRMKIAVAALVGRRKPPRPLRKARVCCTRYSAREADHENLALSFKHAVDGLVACGVLEDDSPRHAQREYGWEYAPKGKGSMRIVVEEVP